MFAKGGQKILSVYKLAETEKKFADIIWDMEPIPSMELVRICEEKLHWKKSTTYTVLKKLCVRGIFQNENAVVTARISRDEFYAEKSRQFVQDTFHGSLPQFLTAFIGRKKLSKEQVDEMKRLIESYQEED